MQQSFKMIDKESIKDQVFEEVFVCALQSNQKGLTCYPMTLYKRESTADIFLGIFNFFSVKLFYKAALNN